MNTAEFRCWIVNDTVVAVRAKVMTLKAVYYAVVGRIAVVTVEVFG